MLSFKMIQKNSKSLLFQEKIHVGAQLDRVLFSLPCYMKTIETKKVTPNDELKVSYYKCPVIHKSTDFLAQKKKSEDKEITLKDA